MIPHMHPSSPVLAGGNIVPFTPRDAKPDGRLTWRDRIALHDARDGLAAAGYRYVAHLDETPDGWLYDLVQVFRGAGLWSTWCLVRRGPVVKVWRCADGADLGQFATMADALATMLRAPAWERARRASSD